MISREEKVKEIFAAIEGGMRKRVLDPSGGGCNINKLLNGKVSDKKVDELYSKLVLLKGNGTTTATTMNTVDSMSYAELRSKIIEQETVIKEVSQRLSFLEKKEKENEKKKEPKKILGITVTQKTDIVRGKGYKRWYGIHREGKKYRWIYIGCDLRNGEKNIKAWLIKHKGEQI